MSSVPEWAKEAEKEIREHINSRIKSVEWKDEAGFDSFAEIITKHTPTPDHGAEIEKYKIKLEGLRAEAIAEANGDTIGRVTKYYDGVLHGVNMIVKILAPHYPARDGLVEAARKVCPIEREIRDYPSNEMRVISSRANWLKLRQEIDAALTSAPVSKEREYRELLRRVIELTLSVDDFEALHKEISATLKQGGTE